MTNNNHYRYFRLCLFVSLFFCTTFSSRTIWWPSTKKMLIELVDGTRTSLQTNARQHHRRKQTQPDSHTHTTRPTSRKGLHISDVPIHDATRDLVLLSEKFEAGYKLTRNLEVLTDKLQQTYRELESEKRKTDR